MAKSMSRKSRNLFNGKRTRKFSKFVICMQKTQMFPFQKPTFITLTVEDLDKNLLYDE